MASARVQLVCVVLLFSLTAVPVSAQTSLSGDRLRIARLTSPVTIDGDLSEDAWKRAERVDRWYETNPSDNTEPKVRSVGYLAYDDKFFYAAFEFDDPAPAQIRAPVSDRDRVSGNSTDYGGIILDTRNDGRTAVLLLATPRGVQYDADTDDAAGEDEAPDYFWDSAATITDRGWTLEIRVPFSSLRYRSADRQTWGILLYRNYPRDFRYQMFSARLPRGGNCFICRSNILLRTPIQAVYTRTITEPRWGGRITGKSRGVSYTALFADDKGGGSVVLPGANGSELADQDFGLYVVIARARRDIGRSFVSVLATDRESHDGQGYNRVVGPDFQWRWKNEVVTGQSLFSTSRTPNRPDLADEWTGQSLSGHAVDINWSHTTEHFDSFAGHRDIGDGFRADTGFVPQVGVRESFGGGGWTFRPDGFARRLRVFANGIHQIDRAGALVGEGFTPGFGMDVKWGGFLQFRAINERTRAGDAVFTKRQLGYVVRFNPTRRIAQISVDGNIGDEIDFSNARLGRGGSFNLYARVNPTDHLELEGQQNQRVLDVDDAIGASRRLFTARVSRVRGTYNVTSNFFTRAIVQYVSTTRDPSLYTDSVDPRSGTLSGSVLVAYKINWQSVLFVGYGDDRELDEQEKLQQSSRQFFVKVSYAFQR